MVYCLLTCQHARLIKGFQVWSVLPEMSQVCGSQTFPVGFLFEWTGGKTSSHSSPPCLLVLYPSSNVTVVAMPFHPFSLPLVLFWLFCLFLSPSPPTHLSFILWISIFPLIFVHSSTHLVTPSFISHKANKKVTLRILEGCICWENPLASCTFDQNIWGKEEKLGLEAACCLSQRHVAIPRSSSNWVPLPSYT